MEINRFRSRLSGVIFPLLGRILMWKNKYINVIYYHDIVKGPNEGCMRMNIDLFKKQMNYIADNRYETLRFDELEDEKQVSFKKKIILITFDDGWLSNYSEIFDFMKQKGIKYNVFLTIKEIGTNPEYLTWDMVREMHDSGLCGFGAHTYSHPDMSDLTKIDFDVEINKADAIFERELGYRPMDFCYPFGYYSDDSNKTLLSKSSYKRIYTSKQFFSFKAEDKFIMGRNPINSNRSYSEFIEEVKGHYNCYCAIRYLF